MIQSILMMGGLGVAIGVVLVIAAKAFYVYEDPKVVAINEALPGANCGGCGYPGCSANAEAIVQGLQDVNSCVAAGDDVALEIAAIMGVSVSDKEPEFANPGCYYSSSKADLNYVYHGIKDCRAAAMLMGGMKVCRIGCLGLGTCVTACKFGALSMGENGLPVVDQEKCTGCGACEKICPKNIIRLTSVTRRIVREYTEGDCTTPCQRACPSGVNIKEYIRRITESDFHGALAVIKERMPFPTVISRICPATCEFNCRRLLQDESVAINGLKRFVCDYEMNQDKRVQPYKAPGTGKKIAVIGGGVEGLAAAFFSARLGHEPTVYEATDKLGGILRKAIARERLSMDILDWDIQGVLDMGVEAKTKTKAGKDFTIPGLLKEGFDAVGVASGGWDSRLARGDIHGAENTLPQTYLLIDLLRSISHDSFQIPSGERVVIAGGGKRLSDAVSQLRTKGAKKITIVLRQSEQDLGFDPQEIQGLAEEDTVILQNAGITKLEGCEERLEAIEITDLDSGEVRKVAADTLIIGSGRFPELVFTPVLPEVPEGDEAPGKESVEQETDLVWVANEFLKKPDSNQELGILSGQDAVSEYSSAVTAINGGRKMAVAMHNMMYGLDFQDKTDIVTDKSRIQNVDFLTHVGKSPRHRLVPSEAKENLKDGFSTGFSTQTALEEANRCLQCGLVCYEKSKVTEITSSVDV